VQAGESDHGQPDDLSSLLAESVKKHKLPGMAAAIVDGGRITAIGAAGVRCRGHQEKITTDDLFHIGSDTKSMTATLIAILVEEGKLRWTSTPVEIFSAHGVKQIDPAWKKVTLEELLSHHAGVRPNPDMTTLAMVMLFKPREQRLRVCRAILQKPPDHEPNKDFLYSNAGYIVAGAMAEAVTDEAWEDLMRKRVFNPLGMKHAGFGPPGLPHKGVKPSSAISQPWGHPASGPPVEPGVGADNPPALGPAGTVHLTLSDWASYAVLHLSAERAESNPSANGARPLLPIAALRHLHAPIGGPIEKGSVKYAMGWGVVPRSTGQIELTHSGSNGMWYAVISLRPWENRALLIVTNQGGEGATLACNEVKAALLKRTGKLEKGRK
jgi:CubicO group peptidase (beta-lactamase class C family)